MSKIPPVFGAGQRPYEILRLIKTELASISIPTDKLHAAGWKRCAVTYFNKVIFRTAVMLPAVSRQKYTPLDRRVPSNVNVYFPAGKRPSARTATSLPRTSYTANRTTLGTDHWPLTTVFGLNGFG